MARKRLDAIASFSVLATTPDAERSARDILASHGIPAEYPEDALHIAIAAIGGMDFIVTRNFSLINNPFTKMMIRQTVENAGSRHAGPAENKFHPCGFGMSRLP